MSILDNLLNFEQEIDDLEEQDRERGEANPTTTTVAAQQSAAPEETKKCEHNRIRGHPETGAICLECLEWLTGRETQELDFRQFGLLFCDEQEYLRAEYGKIQVSEKKRELMENRKLVLVLDLDNTLLHTELFDVGCLVVPRSANGE